MSCLSPAQILELWDCGSRRHPLDRALLLLRSQQRDEQACDLADISIAQRDQMLLELREAMFGRELPGYIDCPGCKTRLEFTLDTETMHGEVSNTSLKLDELFIHSPTSRDLANVMSEPDPEKAAYRLAQRCCMNGESGSSGRAPQLDAVQVERIESALAEIDAAADIVLNFSCIQCGFSWQTPFDIGEYLWREIDTYARKVMVEIHTLARAYGWNEREILDLSDARRAMYIGMVLG